MCNLESRHYEYLDAVNPVDGSKFTVKVSHERMQNVANRGRGHVYEMAYVLPEVLMKPKAIFEGLRIDEEDPKDEIIGSLIKGVSKYCQKLKEKLPGFIIEIHEGSIMLGHFFLARMWESDMENMRVIVYKKLQETAERTKVRVPICKA